MSWATHAKEGRALIYFCGNDNEAKACVRNFSSNLSSILLMPVHFFTRACWNPWRSSGLHPLINSAWGVNMRGVFCVARHKELMNYETIALVFHDGQHAASVGISCAARQLTQKKGSHCSGEPCHVHNHRLAGRILGC
jgi:hypothetical protein